MLYRKINTQKTAKRYLENLALSANLTALRIVPQSRFCIMFMSSHFDRFSDQFTLSVELRLQKSIL